MGGIIGWHCNDCNESQSFYCGGGMFWINEEEVVEYSKEGKLGHAMRTLFGNGIPEGWTVFRKNEFYRCPNCGSIIRGGGFDIDDRSGGWFVYHLSPVPCGSCGEELTFRDDKVPLSYRELVQYCEERIKDGCPKCGGRNVTVDEGNWD